MERQRIAREIHDSLGQLLVILKMRYERIPVSNESKEQSEALSALIKETITEARRISNDLSSSVLQELGLPNAVRSLIQNMKEVSDISFEYTDCGTIT